MATDTTELRAAVRAALTRPGYLRMHFQPIVDLARGVIAGYEALARFAGPLQAPPDRWFAAAHEQGLGDALEARAVAAALDARTALPPNTFLSLNVGPRALRAALVREAFAAHPDLRGVVVEITEREAVHDYEALAAALTPLREQGALLAVDDAGAGFASLQHITRLRPAIIKVDRELVGGCDRDAARGAVLETLGIFGSRIDAWLVAEGVETMGELHRLIGLGVPLAQGYGLGRPARAMEPVQPDVAVQCRRRATLGRSGGLAALAEPALTRPADGGRAEISRALLAAPSGTWLVLLDEHGRPIGLAQRAQGSFDRHAPLCVSDRDDLHDVARRVCARPEADRFDAVALCDDLGRFAGLIPVERLLHALADEASGAEAPAAPRARLLA